MRFSRESKQFDPELTVLPALICCIDVWTERAASPNASLDLAPPYSFAENEIHHSDSHGDDLHVSCPPHTTERKLITKIDWRVIPLLCILYLLAFLDRVNIANANVYGLAKELGLSGNKYNNALVIFFVPYVLFEIPSNILLKKFKPHVWLSGCMFMFGLVTLLQGFVKSYSGLLATRFFLGFFETGMFPGCFYLIGMWYTRREAQKRYSFFFSSTTLAGAFGGLLAAAIGNLNLTNTRYSGWRWIFIIEGAVTCIVSFCFYF
ncbi:High-affinity nicotinic acid transporter, partial [Elasticomyces elasticus]